MIMIMVGTHDVLTGNLEFINTLKKIFVQLNHDFPTAEVVVSSLFPMNTSRSAALHHRQSQQSYRGIRYADRLLFSGYYTTDSAPQISRFF